MAKKSTSVIPKAGGIVFDEKREKILVIHRKKYNDYTLPKGKLEKDETYEQGAVREVVEETGFSVKILDFAGVFSYVVEDKISVIWFFTMQVSGETQTLSAEDINDVTFEWLLPNEAVKRLTHPELADFVEKTTATAVSLDLPQEPPFYWFLWNKVYDLQAIRLADTLTEHRSQLLRWNAATEPWFREACKLFNEALKAYHQQNYDLAWRHMRSAELQEVERFDNKACELEAKKLWEERYKLKEWRQKLVESLLEKFYPTDEKENPKYKEDTPLSERKGLLKQAIRVRGEFFDNEHQRKTILRRRIVPISIIFGFIAVVLPFARNWILGCSSIFPNTQTLLMIELFGLMGACVSVAQNLTKNYETSNLIKQFSEWTDSIFRVSFGPIAAILVVILVKTKLINIPDDLLMLCVYAFASGFSERLVLQIVGGLTDKTSVEKDKNEKKK